MELENECRAKIADSVENAMKAEIVATSNLYHGVFHEAT